MTPESDLTASDWPVFIGCIGNVYDRAAKFHIIMEMELVVHNCGSFADAVIMFFALNYILNLHYPQHKKRIAYFFEFVQKVVFRIDEGKLSPRMTTFLNQIRKM